MAAHSHPRHAFCATSVRLLLFAVVLLLVDARLDPSATHTASFNVTPRPPLTAFIADKKASVLAVLRRFPSLFYLSDLGVSLRSMITPAVLCAALPCLWFFKRHRQSDQASLAGSLRSVSDSIGLGECVWHFCLCIIGLHILPKNCPNNKPSSAHKISPFSET